MANVRRPPDDDEQFLDRLEAAGRRLGRLSRGMLLGFGLVVLFVAAGGYYWFVQRVEVPSGELLVLVRKVGQPLPAEAEYDTVLYPALLKTLGEPEDSTKFKGIVYEPLTEGRYFFDPLFWERLPAKPTILSKGKSSGGLDTNDEIGILVRKYGKPLPPGKVVATEPDERGPLPDVLKPGRYNINPYAYEVKKVKPVFIPEGFVGVQTLYSGEDAADPNQFVVRAGERGVQPDVLPPGMYYNNPYVRRIDLIDVRTQSLDLTGGDAIRFPSNDSFTIIVEATVQYAVRQDQAPYVFAAIGDHEDIAEKLILPFVRSLSRIEGSKLLARDFISGEQRSAWQDHVFQAVSDQGYAQGLDIQQVLIRRIDPPAQIAGPISERQVAEQEINRFRKEIELAKSQAAYVEQEEMQRLNREVGEARRGVVSMTTESEQERSVALTDAQKRLEVARLRLEAAKEQAAAQLARGTAEAEVIRLNYEAEARPLRDAVAAFGGGDAYAQYFFYQKLAPSVKSILASTDGPFADIFRSLSRAESGGAPLPRFEPPTAAVAAEEKGGGE